MSLYFSFKQKTAYGFLLSHVGSEMCIRKSIMIISRNLFIWKPLWQLDPTIKVIIEPFFCIISYSGLDTFDTFKHGLLYLLYIFIISSFSTMAAKILLSHRRSWTAYRGFMRRIRSLCWRFRRGWGKIESIKCLNAWP